MDNELTTNIHAFLFDRSLHELVFTEAGRTHLLLKSRYDADTDFLYHQYRYDSPIPHEVDQKLDYAGILSYKRGSLFDPAYRLRDWVTCAPGRDELIKNVKRKITEEIRRLVNDTPVPVTEQAEPCQRDCEYFLKYEADSKAYALFYAGETTIAYAPYFTVDNPSSADYVRMINDEQGFIEDSVKTYILKKANVINTRLWELGEIQRRLNELIASPGEHHVRRAIAGSITGEMKMVNVHVEKDGQTGVFKVEAGAVVREAQSNSYIGTYSLDAPSRQKFERMFGRHESLQITDIVRITYGKKALFERDEHSEANNSR